MTEKKQEYCLKGAQDVSHLPLVLQSSNGSSDGDSYSCTGGKNVQ